MQSSSSIQCALCTQLYEAQPYSSLLHSTVYLQFEIFLRPMFNSATIVIHNSTQRADKIHDKAKQEKRENEKKKKNGDPSQKRKQRGRKKCTSKIAENFPSWLQIAFHRNTPPQHADKTNSLKHFAFSL